VIQLKEPPPPPPHDVVRARSIFNEVAPRLSNGDVKKAMRLLAPHDPQAALQLAQVEPHATSIGADEAREVVITSLARTGSRHTDWSTAHLADITDNNRFVAATVALGLSLAASEPQKATELLRRAQTRVDPQHNAADAMRSKALVAALALRLNLPTASRLLDAGIVAAERKPENGGLMALVPIVARGSFKAAQEMIEQLPESQQLSAINAAVPELARHDAAGARKLLDRMHGLIQQLKEEPNDSDGRERGRRAWSGAFSWATKHVIRGLGTSNVAVDSLTALAQRVDDQWNRPATLAMAAFGPAAQRVSLLQEAAGEACQGPWMQAVTRSRLAALMSELDIPVAQDMFGLARTQLGSDTDPSGWRHGVADFAFYVSTVDAAEARLLL
jgi:hypothetical protein